MEWSGVEWNGEKRRELEDRRREGVSVGKLAWR